MSYIKCPDCGKEIKIFGESHIDQITLEHHIPLLGRIPMEPKLAAASDAGMIELFEGDWIDTIGNKLDEMFEG